MTLIALLRRIIHTNPALHRLARAVRQRLARLATRLAGETRLQLDSRQQDEAIELKLYSLRSRLNRATARAEAERMARITAEARLGELSGDLHQDERMGASAVGRITPSSLSMPVELRSVS